MDTNTDPVRALTAKWRRQAAEHGTRTFTGNDHALFANELEAALASAPVGLSPEDRVVLMRLKDALPDVGLNGWINGVRVIERILAQKPAAPHHIAEMVHKAVALPKLRRTHPDYSREEVQWVFGYNAALDDVMRLNKNTAAPPSAPEPEVHSYDPTEHRESVTIRWPDGKCLGYVLDRTRYTDNLPPSAPVGVDFAAVASILRRAMRDGAYYGYRRDFILQQALALEALSQQPAAVDGPDAQAAEIEALRAEVDALAAQQRS